MSPVDLQSYPGASPAGRPLFIIVDKDKLSELGGKKLIYEFLKD